LGSTSYITGKNGEITQHCEYIAFGEILFEEHQNSFSSPYLFNGKELDRETNLTYYGARYLDMKTSLWLTVDPEMERYPNLGSYVYCMNNPIVYTDPDGRSPDPPSKGWNRFWGGLRVVGGAIQVVGGAVGGAATSWTGVGAVVGGIAVVHGADDLQAGARQLWSGEETESLTYKGVKKGAEFAGASEETAGRIATFTDIGLSFVGGAGGAFKVFSRAGKVAEFTVAEAKFDYFFGRVIEGSSHNVSRSAQNLKDLTTLGINTEEKLVKVFAETLSKGTEISQATNKYGTTITKALDIGNKGRIETSFFYEGGDLSKIPKITTLIPKIFKTP
jgi:RHS repeat-associated protein